MEQARINGSHRRWLTRIGLAAIVLLLTWGCLLFFRGGGNESGPAVADAVGPDSRQAEEVASAVLSARMQPEEPEQADLGTMIAEERSKQVPASRSLDHLNDAQILDLLRSDDPDSKRRAAAEIVKRSEPRLVAALLDEASNTAFLPLRVDLVDAVAEVDARESAEAMVRHVGLRRDSDLKRSVHAALVAAGSPSIVDALVSKAEEHLYDEYMGREIGRVLSEMRNPEAINELVDGLNTMNYKVFVGCAAALGAIGEPESLEALKAYAGRGGDYDAVIEEALSRVRNESVLPLLSEWALDGTQPAYPVRHGLLRALGEMESVQVNSVLNSILQYEHDCTLRQVAAALLEERLERMQ